MRRGQSPFVRRHHIGVALQQQAAGFKVATLRGEMQWSPAIAEENKGVNRVLRLKVIKLYNPMGEKNGWGRLKKGTGRNNHLPPILAINKID